MIEWHSRFLRHVELWFDEPMPNSDFDVVMHRQAPAPVEGAVNEEFYTLMIDLTQSEDQIFKSFDRNTRSKISKAEKGDAPVFKMIMKPTAQEMEAFIAYYNAFAESKGLEKLFDPILHGCLESGMMSFSQVLCGDDILVWHAQIAYGQRVTVTHSASHFRDAGDPEARNRVGRANRYNHWNEMLFFKKQGFQAYDMGGWYAGETDQSLLMVNRFKEEFGGEKICEFNSRQEVSLRAKAISLVRDRLAS